MKHNLTINTNMDVCRNFSGRTIFGGPNSLGGAKFEVHGTQWRAEGFGCPPTKYIYIYIFFSHFPKFYQDFSCYFRKLPPENSDDLFSHFSQFPLFLSEHLSGCPLYPGCPGPFSLFTHVYPYFFDIYLCIFLKTPSLYTPWVMPGPSHPPHPPLHATVKR